ncbi:MAG TPA: hypothetical protein VGN16_12185 [Acidobacteriaceae bacterium]|jgi:hypothetical protein
MPRQGFLLLLVILCFSIPEIHGQTSNDPDHGGLATGFYGSSGTGSGSAGVFLGLYSTGRFPHLGSNGGLFLDLGVAGPTAKTPVDGTFSVNWQPTWNPPRKSSKLILPFITTGYTRYFLTGNAVNYGGGVLWHLPRRQVGSENVLRLEYREMLFFDGHRVPTVRIAYQNDFNDD